IHWRALAIAIRSASRRLALIGVLCAGTRMMPLTAAGAGVVQGAAIVVTLAVRGRAEVFAGSWACAGSMIWRSRSSRWFGVRLTNELPVTMARHRDRPVAVTKAAAMPSASCSACLFAGPRPSPGSDPRGMAPALLFWESQGHQENSYGCNGGALEVE